MIGAHTGLPWPAIYNRPRGGGPPPYAAKAVHFDGASWLSNPSLVSTNNGLFSAVLWCKVRSPHTLGLPNTPLMFSSDPENTDNLWISQGNNPDDLNLPAGEFNMASLDNNGVHGYTPLVDNGWCNVIMSANIGVNPNLFNIYLNGVASLEGASGSTVIDSFGTNGKTFYFGTDTFDVPVLGDFADVRIMPGISLLDGSGNIPAATLGLFINGSGKPVDPAIATAALGAPAILFSGDASTFATNQGTGGAFTTTGSLTNAATSPSD